MVRRSNKFWTAAVTRYCEETRAASHVERQGFEFYLPYIEERVGGRWRKTLMFPGYLLVKLDSEWRRLCSTRGIARLLMFGEGPSRLHAHHVESLRSREDSRGIVQLHPRLSVGDCARTYGGFKGIVQETLPHDRCRLLMEIMGRQVVGEFDARELVLA